jgi:acyl transferase domain-containing protein
MLDLSENRWKGISYDLPKYSGFMPNVQKFDGKFFGLPDKRVDVMDPQSRILLEHAYEAIFDAGVYTNQ